MTDKTNEIDEQQNEELEQDEQTNESDEQTNEQDNDNKDENEQDDKDGGDEPLGEAGQRAYDRIKAERNALRDEIQTLKQQNESEQERALREAREEAANEASSTWKSRFVKAEAKQALTAAGLSKAQDRMLNLIDLETVEIDDDGAVSGLDDQINELKDEFPELFATKRRVGKGDTGDRKESSTPKTIGEQIAAQMQR